MGLESLQTGLQNAGTAIVGALQNPVVTGVGGAVIGAGVGGLVTSAVIRSSTKRKRRKSRAVRKRNYRSKKRRKQKQPYTARKRKDTSHKRIRFTKNNQPYIILASGKARFISKKSAKSSRSRKGGRY